MAAGYRRPDAGFVRGGVEAEEVAAPHWQNKSWWRAPGQGPPLSHTQLHLFRTRCIGNELQARHQNASLVGQRCAGLSPGSADRKRQIAPYPRRTLPGFRFSVRTSCSHSPTHRLVIDCSTGGRNFLSKSRSTSHPSPELCTMKFGKCAARA